MESEIETKKIDNISHSTKNFIIVLLLLITIGLGAILLLKKAGISMDVYRATLDTLETSRDKLGHQMATIDALNFENKTQFIKLQTNDSTIKWLQQTVKDFKGSITTAIVAAVNTISKGSTKTEVIAGDTIRIGDTLKLYPKYKANWTNKWEVGSIIAGKDSIYRSIKVINDYEITIGEPKRKLMNLFKTPDTEVTLKNLNPNTVTSELRNFNVKNHQKRLGLGLSTGVALTSDFKVTAYIGVGLNFNIIEFK